MGKVRCLHCNSLLKLNVALYQYDAVTSFLVVHSYLAGRFWFVYIGKMCIEKVQVYLTYIHTLIWL